MKRNPFSSISNEPITQEQVRELRDRLVVFWEDTTLVTDPNRYKIIQVGNLKAVVDTLIDLMNERGCDDD